MSVQALTWVLGHRRRGEWVIPPAVTPSMKARLVLIALANHANDDFEAWPSAQTLCTETGMSRATVWRAMVELRDAGLVSWVRSGGPAPTRNHPNKYLLLVDNPSDDVATVKRRGSDDVAKHAHDVSTRRHDVATSRHEPLEPSYNNRVRLSTTPVHLFGSGLMLADVTVDEYEARAARRVNG